MIRNAPASGSQVRCLDCKKYATRKAMARSKAKKKAPSLSSSSVKLNTELSEQELECATAADAFATGNVNKTVFAKARPKPSLEKEKKKTCNIKQLNAGYGTIQNNYSLLQFCFSTAGWRKREASSAPTLPLCHRKMERKTQRKWEGPLYI